LAAARADARVSGGALTGSAVAGGEDRWSDIDLSFGVADGVDPEAVLTDWTELLADELGVLHHWDLRRGSTIYRVFLLPGGLELDIAVTPAGEFGAHGPSFRLVFGASVEHPPTAPPALDDMIGFGWLYALNARGSIARGKVWQAEYWISGLRDQAQALACLRAGEPAAYAREVDRLPHDALAPYQEALVRSLDTEELRRALAVAAELFLAEAGEAAPQLAQRLQAPLRDAAGR